MTFVELYNQMGDIILKTAPTALDSMNKQVLCEGGCFGIDSIVEYDDCFILKLEERDAVSKN